MYNTSRSRIHGKHGHSEVHSYISEFPTLKENKTLYSPTLSPYDQARMDLMINSKNKEQFKLEFCYKTCFKLTDQKYVDFCLQKKCNSNLKRAAAALKILK